jgi:hypothetical protein
VVLLVSLVTYWCSFGFLYLYVIPEDLIGNMVFLAS